MANKILSRDFSIPIHQGKKKVIPEFLAKKEGFHSKNEVIDIVSHRSLGFKQDAAS